MALANQLQGIFAAVFRQNALHLFESDIHRRRRQKGELSIDEFNQYFQKRLQAMFGHGLKLTQNHQSWWMPILHFYLTPQETVSLAGVDFAQKGFWDQGLNLIEKSVIEFENLSG